MKKRKPNRLKEYDYSKSAWYFVTICTTDHIDHFGKVVNSEIILNEYGKVVDSCWQQIPNHYQNVEIDQYILMPNHLHGIIIINYVGVDYYRPGSPNANIKPKDEKNLRDENIRPLQSTNLSNVVKGFKIGVTKRCKENGISNFKWQRSFFDRIIRDDKELFNIRKYILQKPLKWEIEKHIDNLGL